MRDRDTPLRYIRMWERAYPDAFASLDVMRKAKYERRDNPEEDLTWPDYCELPLNAAYTYLYMQGLSDAKCAEHCSGLTAAWLWRKSKVVYRFDQDLAEELWQQILDTDEDEKIPDNILLHPPYPCVYVKCGGIVDDADGFFSFIDYDVNDGKTALRVNWLSKDMQYSAAQVLHIKAGATIGECIEDTLATTKENWRKYGEGSGIDYDEEKPGVGISRIMLAAIQMMLYLSAENAEIERVESDKSSETKKGKPQKSEKNKKGESEPTRASFVKEYAVGVRLGAAIRKYKSGAGHTEHGVGSAKRPHSRRGHWHHYWTGPLNGERKLILKWTAPTYIHAADLTDEVVIHPVKGKK